MLCLCLGDCGGSPNGTEAVCNVLCAQVNTCPYPEYCTVEAKGGGRKHEKFYSWDLECAASGFSQNSKPVFQRASGDFSDSSQTRALL